MTRYILRRLLWAFVLLIAVSLLTFVIFYVLPSGDPARLRAGPRARPDVLAEIREQLGLDRGLLSQFGDFMQGLLLHFDLGYSYSTGAEVKAEILERLPASISLAAGALVIWLTVGIAVGVISATHPGSVRDRLAMGGALVAISAPVYWLGLVSLYLFASDIGQFPVFPGSGAYQNADGFFAKIPTMILPWIILAAAFTAIYARLMRGNMIEVLSEDYIRTARAKGVPERRVIIRHAARSAMTPVVTVFGIDVGVLMGGAILTETVFNINGVGRLSYEAINRHDLPTIQGTTLFLALGVCVASLVVDILYAFLDPRVRYD
jgi:peptide/nickel transport system permease protein